MRGKRGVAVSKSGASLSASINALIAEKTTPLVPTRPVLTAVVVDELVDEPAAAAAQENILELDAAAAMQEVAAEAENLELDAAADEAEVEAVADLEDESYVDDSAASPFAAVLAEESQEAEAAVDPAEPEQAIESVYATPVDADSLPEHLKKFDPKAALSIEAVDVAVVDTNPQTDFINETITGLHESAAAAAEPKKKPRRPWLRGSHQHAPAGPVTTPPIVEQLAEFSETEFGKPIFGGDLPSLTPPPALVSDEVPNLEGFDPSRYMGMGTIAPPEPEPANDLSAVAAPLTTSSSEPLVPDFTEVAEAAEPARDSRAVMQMLRELAALRHE